MSEFVLIVLKSFKTAYKIYERRTRAASVEEVYYLRSTGVKALNDSSSSHASNRLSLKRESIKIKKVDLTPLGNTSHCNSIKYVLENFPNLRCIFSHMEVASVNSLLTSSVHIYLSAKSISPLQYLSISAIIKRLQQRSGRENHLQYLLRSTCT